jgi:predicted permease
MSLLRRLLNRRREQAIATELDEEIEFHLQQRIARNLRDGLDETAARAEARRHFGNVGLAREEMRQARVASWVDDFFCDVRYAIRVFARQPLLTGIAVVTLALGIGANAAIYSVLNAVLFRPLSFPHADRAVLVVERLRSGGGTSPTIPEILDIRARSQSLDVVSFFDTRDAQIDGGSEPAHVVTARVDPAFLPLVGARPAHGRLFDESDSAEGSPRVVLLSHGFWRRNFGASPDIVGRTVTVNGASNRIAGVLAADFTLTFISGEPEMYVPYPLVPAYTQRTAEFANVRRVMTLGRLKPGISLERASADLATVTAGLVAEHPQLYAEFGGAANFSIDVQPLREAIGESGQRPLYLLFGAVIVVLLIACVNAAQFLLSHAIERGPEVALRSALGAGRVRLVRQFLSETLLLALSAGTLGLALAYGLVGLLRAGLPGMLMVGEIDLDWRVLAFVAALALGTTFLCGLMPSLRFSRGQPGPSLKLHTRGGSTRRSRARHVLVAVEVALSVVLLVQAVLLMRSLGALQRDQTGFSPASVMSMRVRGMAGGGPALGLQYQRYLEAMGRLPDVAQSAASSSVLPGRPSTPFTVPGRSETDAARTRQNTSYQIVSPNYFDVLNIPLRHGRTFAGTDTAGTTPVAVINEEMARLHWPGESPIGQRMLAGTGPRQATMTIVGVVGNVRPPFQTSDVPQLYVSYLQQSEPSMFILVRPQPGRPVRMDAIKAAIWSVEPRQAVFAIQPLDELIGQAVYGQRVVTTIIGSFAGLAVVMSIAGIFAVISYLTSRRLKEVALRRAIGAQSSDVLRLLAGHTFLWTLIGLVAGAGAATLASGTFRAIVPGLLPLDVATVVLTSLAYLVIVAIATILPSVQGLRVDPASLLRAE